VNAASARYVLLSFGGRRFRMLATSGGLLETPITTNAVLLTPGDRVDIAMGPLEEGEIISVESLPYDRHSGRKHVEAIRTIRVGPPLPSTASVPDRLRHDRAPRSEQCDADRRNFLLSGRSSLRHRRGLPDQREVHHTDKPVTVVSFRSGKSSTTPDGSPVPLARLSFRCSAKTGRRRVSLVEDTVKRAGEQSRRHCLDAGRSAGGLDVSLPHPRAPRRGMMAHFCRGAPGESLDSDQLAAISHHHHH